MGTPQEPWRIALGKHFASLTSVFPQPAKSFANGFYAHAHEPDVAARKSRAIAYLKISHG